VTIMVDELRKWPTKIAVFLDGSCHLTTHGDIEELHAFAAGIGLRRAWFQNGRVPHYDLDGARRELALTLGATFVPARVQARTRIAARVGRLRALG
jgi:hypothetical protein